MLRHHRVPQVLTVSATALALAIGVGSARADAAVAAPRAEAESCAAGATAGVAAVNAPRETVVAQRLCRQHLVTGPEGRLLVRFSDRSSMTLGPNTDVVVDQFVFDPAAGTGTLSVSVASGLVHYVGGTLSRTPGAVSIHGAAGAIDAHGGAFLLAVAPAGAMKIVSLDRDGPTVTGRSGLPQTLSHPVSVVTVSGGTASAPTALSADSWTQLLAEAAAPARPQQAAAVAR